MNQQSQKHGANGRNTVARNGFTLIELLVVVAIIVILAAILFPVFGRARENARRSSCQSNMKQIGLAYLQYTQDFDETSPLLQSAFVAGGSTRGAPWAQLLQTYTKSTQVFNCPSDEETTPHPGMGQRSDGTYNYDARAFGFVEPFHLSYIASRSVFNFGPVMVPRIISPSTVIGFADGGLTGSANPPYVLRDSPKPRAYIMDYSVNPNNPSNAANVVGTTAAWAGPNPRHLETVVVGYMDGHAKALRLDKFYKPKVFNVPGCLDIDNEKPCS